MGAGHATVGTREAWVGLHVVILVNAFTSKGRRRGEHAAHGSPAALSACAKRRGVGRDWPGRAVRRHTSPLAFQHSLLSLALSLACTHVLRERGRGGRHNQRAARLSEYEARGTNGNTLCSKESTARRASRGELALATAPHTLYT